MYLCMDIGNSQLHGGVFGVTGELLLQFRYNTSQIGSSDQFGVFLLQVLRENLITPELITKIAVASVVPSVDYSVGSACLKYFKLTAVFLQPGIKTGIKINSNNSSEIGADLIAAGIGGVYSYPGKHLLIFDFGTATTLIYVNNFSEFIGGSLLPGMRLMMESLGSNTAKLFPVSISIPKVPISKDTKTAIQSGLYYSQIGAVRELIKAVIASYNILREELTIIATGGFANLLNENQLFDVVVPDLILRGLRQVLLINQ